MTKYNSDKGSNSKGSSLASSRSCHNGPKLLIDKDGVELYGGSIGEAEANYYKFDLIISMAHLNIYKNINSVYKGSNVKSIRLGQFIGDNSPEILCIDWPDMGIPNLKVDWDELARIIKKRGKDRERRGNKYRVLCHCIGGHGRTGTALAILVNKIYGITKFYNNDYSIEYKDVVEYIRKEYCSHAIESTSQLGYIEEITGLKVVSVTRYVHIPVYEGWSEVVDKFNNKHKYVPKIFKKKDKEEVIDIESKEVEYTEKAIEYRYMYGCIEHNSTYCWDCYKKEEKILKDIKDKVKEN